MANIGLSRWFRNGLPIAGLAAIVVTVGFYVEYIVRFGVNVPHLDDWATVGLLAAYKTGGLHFATLWAQHNEDRMLIPNVIAVAIGNASHFNVKIEMYLGALFLGIGAFALVGAVRFLSHRRWFEYAPSIVVMFATVQWEASLWGFEFAWFLVTFCLGGCIYVLCRYRSALGLGLAITFASVGSFCSLQGLLVWPSAGLLLWAGKRSKRSKTIWIGSGAFVWFLYFWHFKFNETGGPGFSFFLSHPVQDGKFFLTALGGFALGHGGFVVAQLLGFGMLVLGITILVIYVFSDHSLLAAVPAVLVLYVFLFDLALVLGRTGYGYGPALQSRYTTYNLLIFPAAYFVILEGKHWSTLPKIVRTLRPFFIAGAAAWVMVLVAVSTTDGVSQSRALEAQLRVSQSVVVNYRLVSNDLIGQYLTFEPTAANVADTRTLLSFLDSQHDSVFDDASLVAALRYTPSRRELLPASDLIPVSPPLHDAIKNSLALQNVWAVLSTVYEERPDLQQAFPTSAPKFDQDVLGWAIHYGATTDYENPYLRPEMPSLERLYRIASGS